MVREVNTIDEYNACITLQREVFGLPDLEISPRRHLIVSREAGGWTLGAFIRGELVGFVHHLAAVHGDEIFGYSHMMAVTTRYQNHGIGARLKWAQRMRALSEGRDFIKWTFEPMRARNAHFNLNRLGVVVCSYAVNFYGTDYVTNPAEKAAGISGMDSDRLFASWELRSPRVEAFAAQLEYLLPAPDATIEIPADWMPASCAALSNVMSIGHAICFIRITIATEAHQSHKAKTNKRSKQLLASAVFSRRLRVSVARGSPKVHLRVCNCQNNLPSKKQFTGFVRKFAATMTCITSRTIPNFPTKSMTS